MYISKGTDLFAVKAMLRFFDFFFGQRIVSHVPMRPVSEVVRKYLTPRCEKRFCPSEFECQAALL